MLSILLLNSSNRLNEFQRFFKKIITDIITHIINNKGLWRTALGTPGLLKTEQQRFKDTKGNVSKSRRMKIGPSQVNFFFN